jgi:hypothetical protein
MGADLDVIDGWVKTHVDPLVEAAAIKGPDQSVKGGKAAMDAYLGIALYVDQLFGHATFSRTFRFAQQDDPETIWDAVAAAVEELPKTTVKLPKSWVGKTVWLPVSVGSFSGAPVMAKRKGWVQFKVPATPVTVAGIVDQDSGRRR